MAPPSLLAGADFVGMQGNDDGRPSGANCRRFVASDVSFSPEGRPDVVLRPVTRPDPNRPPSPPRPTGGRRLHPPPDRETTDSPRPAHAPMAAPVSAFGLAVAVVLLLLLARR